MNNADGLHDVAHGHLTAISFLVGLGPIVLVILGTLVLMILSARKAS